MIDLIQNSHLVHFQWWFGFLAGSAVTGAILVALIFWNLWGMIRDHQ